MGQEERSREEPDDGEPDAVLLREQVRDGPDVRDVERDGGAERERPAEAYESAIQATVRSVSRSSACTESSRCSCFVSSSFVCESPRRL